MGVLMEKSRILLIDDEPELLELLKDKLELESYEVFTAPDGEEGLKSIKAQKPDLIICDVKMPKKNGFEVLKEFRQDESNNAQFIMLTVVDDFEKIKEAYEDKADFYVTKPVEIEKLLKNIRTLLNISKSKI